MNSPFISHLEELRNRFIKILIFFILFFIISFIFSNNIILLLQNSILRDIKLIVISPFEFIITKLTLSLFLGIFLTFPIIIYHIILFSKPALSKKEKKLLIPLTFSSFILFIIGVLFGYLILLKIGINYLANLSISANILNLWSFSKVINFIFFTILIIGFIFQTPLFILLLNKLNILKKETLKTNRPFIYVLIFIFAAILTPPDPITQLLIALPLILLFELSLLLVKLTP